MGCDIHCYIESGREVRDWDSDDTDARKTRWSPFGGRINPGRDYGIFGALAGVRCPELQLFEPRGLPPRDELGYMARHDNEIFISETPGEGYATREQAEEWCRYGSEIVDEHWVTHPDHHTHSWVTADEWEQAITDPRLDHKVDDDYFAMLAAMREFEKRGHQVRVVFWFDN